MANFSFFYFWKSGSGNIRGKQMAKYLGGRLGPKKNFDKDVCIYVKIEPPENYPKHSYLDINDAVERIAWVRTHPDIGIICISKIQHEFLSEILNRNDLILIPENHCNYERIKRDRKEVTTVGYIGVPAGIQLNTDELRERLKDIGLEFYFNTVYKSREQVVDFYKGIDIQVVWRTGFKDTHSRMRNPLKLANACSFGIPTVCYPEIDYVKEFDGYFIPAYTMDELISYVKRLKEDPKFYEEWSLRSLEKAEEYHIENISKLYKQLLPKEEIDMDLMVGIRAKLLDKEVTINGNKTFVYGLASFNVRPRNRHIGMMLCREFDRLAREDGKYCVIGFAFDEVIPFYEKCGWYNCGKKKDKTAFSSQPIETLNYIEEW